MTGEEPPVHPPFRKKHGLAHLFASAGYSFGGVKRLLREAAFRQELALGAFILAAFATCGAPMASYIAQLALFLVLLAVEALNTAIETLVDRVSPEVSEAARDAKDLGSFAVFAMLCAVCGHALWVLAHQLPPAAIAMF